MMHKMTKAEAKSSVIRLASDIARKYPVVTDDAFYDLQASEKIPTNYIPLIAFSNLTPDLSVVMSELLRATVEEEPKTDGVICPFTSNLNAVLEWLGKSMPTVEIICDTFDSEGKWTFGKIFGKPKTTPAIRKGASYALLLYDLGDGVITRAVNSAVIGFGAKIGKIVAMSDRQYPGGREAAKEATEIEPTVGMTIKELLAMGEYYHQLNLLPLEVLALRNLDKLNISYRPLHETIIPDEIRALMPKIDPQNEPFPVLYPAD